MSIHINIDPIWFTFGSLEVRWYGIMVGLAIITVALWTYNGAKKIGISGEDIFTAALFAVPLGFIFSRLVAVVDDLSYYSDNPGEIFGFSGLTIYGGILGAAIGIWIFTKIKRIPFGQFADIAAPGIILGQAIGRVGCIIEGCCYGTPTKLPWGFVYSNPESPAPLNESTHPAVLYELLFDLAVFGMLLVVRKRIKTGGTLFLLYLASYSTGRFFFTYLRENTTYAGLKEAQIISLVVMAITIPLLMYKIKQQASVVTGENR